MCQTAYQRCGLYLFIDLSNLDLLQEECFKHSSFSSYCEAPSDFHQDDQPCQILMRQQPANQMCIVLGMKLTIQSGLGLVIWPHSGYLEGLIHEQGIMRAGWRVRTRIGRSICFEENCRHCTVMDVEDSALCSLTEGLQNLRMKDITWENICTVVSYLKGSLFLLQNCQAIHMA